MPCLDDKVRFTEAIIKDPEVKHSLVIEPLYQNSQLVLGRENLGNDLPADVSRLHATLVCNRDGEYILMDGRYDNDGIHHPSTYGTYYKDENGGWKTVSSEGITLHAGTEIRLGNYLDFRIPSAFYVSGAADELSELSMAGSRSSYLGTEKGVEVEVEGRVIEEKAVQTEETDTPLVRKLAYSGLCLSGLAASGCLLTGNVGGALLFGAIGYVNYRNLSETDPVRKSIAGLARKARGLLYQALKPFT